jgi:SAM-dependent MidA family methyltransferase
VTLLDRLLDRVRSRGPLGFDEFMEAALFDPEDGFYVRGDRGPGRDFVTSPVLSPLFGATVANLVGPCWEALGRPVPMMVCEVGAGTGRLLADLLGAAADRGDPWLGAADIALVERGEAASRAGGADLPGFRVAARLADLAPFTGLVLANELLDNLPVRLVAAPGGGTQEIRVGESNGRLVLVPSDVEFGLDPVGVRAFLDELALVMVSGYAVLIDYSTDSLYGQLRAFREHRQDADVLADPGDCDVTASVDWDALIEAAGRRGFTLVARLSQRELLMSLGLTSALHLLRAAELAAVASEDTWQSLQMRDRWTRATALVDPNGPGAFEVVILGRNVPSGAQILPG